MKKIINNNIDLIKHVGRVSGILNSYKNKKNIIDILVLKEQISLKFGEEINFDTQMEGIRKKLNNIEKQINALDIKLKNKAYLKKAPKNIVENDKKLIKELTIEDKKLRSIVSSIN